MTILISNELPYPQYDDVIKWKHFPRYWPFEGGIHRSPVKLDSPLDSGTTKVRFTYQSNTILLVSNLGASGDLEPLLLAWIGVDRKMDK